MKLFVAAIAATAVFAEETGGVEDVASCPVGWSDVDGDTDDCAPNNVVVTCNADTMSVTFPIDAVYFAGSLELSDAQLAVAKADIVGQEGEGCFDFDYSLEDETFTISHGLTACGTQADHDTVNGNLVFSNSYIGDEEALTIDGILTTKVLSFKAECTYSDEATVSIDDVTVAMGTNLAETVSEEGAYTFTMVTLDAAGDELSETNKAEIGDQVTLKVTPTNALPTNVEFHLVDCVAAESFTEGEVTEGDKSYNILEEGSCVSDLLEVQFDGEGKSNTEVKLDFNSFTFTAGEDQLDIKCNLKLCLVDDDECVAAVQQQNDDFECEAKYTRSTWFGNLE